MIQIAYLQMYQQILQVLCQQIFITKKLDIKWVLMFSTTMLLMIMLLFIIDVLRDHYAKHRSKLKKSIALLTIKK